MCDICACVAWRGGGDDGHGDDGGDDKKVMILYTKLKKRIDSKPILR